jgi:hypothetical protein
MLSIAFGQSKYYIDNLAENVRRAQRQKTASGVWSWHAPVGYLNDPKSRTIVIDPDKAPLVRRTFELYASGKFAISRLCLEMKEHGLRGHSGRPLSQSQFQHLLSNPFYFGLLRIGGELHEGAHEPLITKSRFDKVQRVMHERSKPNSPHLKPFIYRGMLHCGECGCTITMETQKGRNYLRCSKRKGPCAQRYLREEVLTEQLASALRSVSIPDKWAEWMIAQLAIERDTDAAQYREAEEATQKEMRQMDVKLDRLTTAYLEGVFPVADYRRKKEELLGRKQDAKNRLVIYEQTRSARFEPAVQFIRRSKQAKSIADSGDKQKMRDELEQIGSNLILLNGKLRWEAQGFWKTVVGQGSFAPRERSARGAAASATAEADDLAYWSPLLDSVRRVRTSAALVA